MSFSIIPTRLNGQRIDAGWFNILRTLLITIFGDLQGQVTQEIGDADTNQDIDELVDVDGNSFFKVQVTYTVRRESTAGEYVQSGTFFLHWKSAAGGGWVIKGDQENIIGDDCKIEFNILKNVGVDENVTVRYSTTTIGGSGHLGNITTTVEKWAK